MEDRVGMKADDATNPQVCDFGSGARVGAMVEPLPNNFSFNVMFNTTLSSVMTNSTLEDLDNEVKIHSTSLNIEVKDHSTSITSDKDVIDNKSITSLHLPSL
jgi:hypothetical protein